MTRADILQVAAGLLGDAALQLDTARDCLWAAGLLGSQGETDRLVREVTELWQSTDQAAQTARQAEQGTRVPVVRIVPPDDPGRMYGQGYDGSVMDDGTEAAKGAAIDKLIRRTQGNSNNADNDEKGQD